MLLFLILIEVEDLPVLAYERSIFSLIIIIIVLIIIYTRILLLIFNKK